LICATTCALYQDLGKLIDRLPDAGVSAAERFKREPQLGARILELERQEETLVEAAIEQGINIARRPAANPLAILGIQRQARR
jgi:hypothetical protein